MPTYLITQEIPITRQEGDTADIVFTVPTVLDMTGMTVRFQVFKGRTPYGNKVLISKKTGLGISTSGQVITVTLDPSDTVGISGVRVWELQVVHEAGSNERYTIGRGDFIVKPELIKL